MYDQVSGAIINVLATSVVYHWYGPSQNKYYTIGICCYS